MKSLFWSGKLSLPVRLMVNSNNMLALVNGNFSNKAAMKDRVKSGYDGAFSDHISNYEDLAGEFQRKAAVAQLDGMDLQGKEIIDIGCGSGIISMLALEMGAKRAICGDISEFMLKMAEEKFKVTGYDSSQIGFCRLDAESLPYDDNSFDAVITGMSFGLFPDQPKAVREMFRVLKPGGIVSLGAHGPEHYWEAIDTTIRSLDKKYVLGYRFEFWPRTEKEIIKMMKEAGFCDVRTSRHIWRNLFARPSDACDFFAAVSSNWWYAKIPENRRLQAYEKTRGLFDRKNLRQVTDDVINGYGIKPV